MEMEKQIGICETFIGKLEPEQEVPRFVRIRVANLFRVVESPSAQNKGRSNSNKRVGPNPIMVWLVRFDEEKIDTCRILLVRAVLSTGCRREFLYHVFGVVKRPSLWKAAQPAMYENRGNARKKIVCTPYHCVSGILVVVQKLRTIVQVWTRAVTTAALSRRCLQHFILKTKVVDVKFGFQFRFEWKQESLQVSFITFYT